MPPVPVPNVHCDYSLTLTRSAPGAVPEAIPTKKGSLTYSPGAGFEMLRTSGKLNAEAAIASKVAPKFAATLLDPTEFTDLSIVAAASATFAAYGANGGGLTPVTKYEFANALVCPKSLSWSDGGLAELQVEILALFDANGDGVTGPVASAANPASIDEGYIVETIEIGATTYGSVSQVGINWQDELKPHPEFKPQKYIAETRTMNADVTLSEAISVPLLGETAAFKVNFRKVGTATVFTVNLGTCHIEKTVDAGKTKIKAVRLGEPPA